MPKIPWYQEALFAVEVLEVNARLGVIPGTDHVQALVEIKDPTDDRLIDMWSWPHAPLRELPAVIGEIADRMKAFVDANTEPF